MNGTLTAHQPVWLESEHQRLGLVPQLGGGVAAWRWRASGGDFDIWRPWDGASEDRYSLASFAMLPWSNRISKGGFGHRGRWHSMRPNRAGEPYPIHGNGWLQPWDIARDGQRTALMHLRSKSYGGAPYDYEATQRFELLDDGLQQDIALTNRGDLALPFGLGLHPWFSRTPQVSLRAPVRGVWLSGDDPIPTQHSEDFPASWNLNHDTAMNGSFIDNGFTGWDGTATIHWPELGLRLDAHMMPLQTPGGALAPQHCLVYRPPQGPAFCFEPITQPIDAFHLAGQPGLVELKPHESMSLRVLWRMREGGQSTQVPGG